MTSSSLGDSAVYEDASRKVGIGTSSPDRLLHVAFNIPDTTLLLNSGQLVVENTATGPKSYSGLELRSNDLNANEGVRFTNNAGVNVAVAGFEHSSTAANEHFFFQTKSGTRPFVVMNQSGNVGVGVLNPQAKLDVAAAGAGKTAQIGNFYIDSANPNQIKNASVGVGLHATTPAGVVAFLVNGTLIAQVDATGFKVVSGAKMFDIQDPRYRDPKKRLVHAAIEGPEAAVFYRGSGKLIGGRARVLLPKYFEALTREKSGTVLLTAKGKKPFPLSYDEFDGKGFTVYGTSAEGEFDWEVKATRSDIAPLEVEKIEGSAR
ncbi:MAG: hypothetical protein NDJ89_16340 [Oligoflexia bacterium]|nr:hypothetical protein [Oligoflexia bacterium]